MDILGSLLGFFGSLTAAPLVIYTTVGEDIVRFRSAARTTASLLRVPPRPVVNGQDVLAAVRSTPDGGVNKFVIIGHGTPTEFLAPGVSGIRTGPSALPTWVGISDLAAALFPKLADDYVIALAGCRAGAEDAEADWSATTAGPGGAGSFAGRLRDALASEQKTGEIRAHATRGAALANPAIRVFRSEPQFAGRAGAALIDLRRGVGASQNPNVVRRWNTEVQGNAAVRELLRLT